MNVIHKLTLRQMVMNRRRTIVTILGIMFSVALITAVATFSSSIMDLFKQAEIATHGDWHTAYEDVVPSDLQKIADDSNTREYTAIYNRGFVKTPEWSLRRFITNIQLNPSAYGQMHGVLLEGRLPETPSEIVISKELAEDMPEQYAIGKSVLWELGKRKEIPNEEEQNLLSEGVLTQEDLILSWSSPYQGDIWEEFIPTENTEVTVVGIVDMPAFSQSHYAGYSTFSYLDPNTLPADAHLDVRVAAKDINNSIYERTQVLSESLSDGVTMYYHTSLLLYNGVNSDNAMMTTVHMFVSIAIIIVVIASIALIYNSFAISISERSVNFGMLSGFGATKRQKRRSVLFEALVLAGIGIPLGLALGFAGMAVTYALISPILTNFLTTGGEGVHMQLALEPVSVCAAIVISLLTILVSAWIPAIRASRITPIDAIRKTRDVKLTSREIKTPKIIRKLFGFEAELAMKNFKRNKKRYRITIVSLILSLVLFLSASSFTYYLTGSVDMAMENIDYDIVNYLQIDGKGTTYQEQRELSNQILNEMRQIPEIEQWAAYWNRNYLFHADESALSKQTQENMKEDVGPDYNPADITIEVTLFGMEDEALREYAKRVGVDYNALTDPEHPQGILLNEYDYVREHHGAKLTVLNQKAGDTMRLSDVSDETQEQSVGVAIAALTNQVPMGLSNKTNRTDRVYLFVSREVFDHLMQEMPSIRTNFVTDSMTSDGMTGHMETDPEQNLAPLSVWVLVAGGNDKEIENAMYKVMTPFQEQASANVGNVKSQKQMIEQMVLIVNVFLYGFISLISLVGIANIFNTISTSIALRRRESAMMKSIGMSPKSFRKMMNFESLFYGLKTVLYGLPIGFGVMALIYWVLRRNIEMPFSVPWVHLICGVAGIFIIVVTTMLYSSAKLKRENVIDILRNENA